MDQHELRAWERKCVQEEKPRCVAECPIHVDARTFCALMARKRWDKAWAVLAKTMPLPGILARSCDGQCKSACVRNKAGGAIQMDRLERYCAEQAKPVGPPRPLPSKGKSVVVVGGGMTGLCAAWEIARRGYGVRLMCSVPGGVLTGVSELPGGVLQRELDNLEKLGVSITAGVEYSPDLLDSLLAENDAVFLDRQDFPESLQDFGNSDQISLGTEREGLFAGHWGLGSAVLQAADGRRAANSIERHIQGVSMVSGRELEGPYKSRLFTSLAKVECVPTAVGEGPLDENGARDEAKRCIQCECMECVQVCEYLRHYKAYPKVYVRQIYNNESIVMGTRMANKMINSCMLCGLCKTVCPEDFDMAEVCLTARRTLVEQGNMPPSAHEFALRDMEFANSGKCVINCHAPGADASEYLFFPGCQLTASDPEGVERAYADLRDRLGDVGLLLHCCGAPAKWAGRDDLFEKSCRQLAENWESMGKPKLIVACPSCMNILRETSPGAEILSYWSLLRVMGLPESTAGYGGLLAVHDPCAAREEAVMREDVRSLLELMGATVVEPELTGETTECCGYGGLLANANPQLATAVAERRARAAEEDFVTYCIMCRDQLAHAGKRTVHLYDLLFPSKDDPAARLAPGYSERRENRVRLKERLYRELWQGDGTVPLEPYESVEVDFTDDAVKAMEDRRILKTDVQQVLLQARTSGKWFVNNDSGLSLASFRPSIVTYWVEFEEQGAGFLVHNAWSHRMLITGAQP